MSKTNTIVEPVTEPVTEPVNLMVEYKRRAASILGWAKLVRKAKVYGGISALSDKCKLLAGEIEAIRQLPNNLQLPKACGVGAITPTEFADLVDGLRLSDADIIDRAARGLGVVKTI